MFNRRRFDDLETRLRHVEGVQIELRQLKEEVASMRKEIDGFYLDYTQLYEKVRTTLTKLAKRAERADKADGGPDPLTAARKALIDAKLRKGT